MVLLSLPAQSKVRPRYRTYPVLRMMTMETNPYETRNPSQHLNQPFWPTPPQVNNPVFFTSNWRAKNVTVEQNVLTLALLGNVMFLNT